MFPHLQQRFSYLCTCLVSILTLLFLSSLLPVNPIYFVHFASTHPMQVKGISKSVSMNCGSCQGMLQGLSHSDSYTWAVENRGLGSGRSIDREGSFSSLSSQDMHLTNLIPDYTHTESQVCIHSRNTGRILVVQ